VTPIGSFGRPFEKRSVSNAPTDRRVVLNAAGGGPPGLLRRLACIVLRAERDIERPASARTRMSVAGALIFVQPETGKRGGTSGSGRGSGAAIFPDEAHRVGTPPRTSNVRSHDDFRCWSLFHCCWCFITCPSGYWQTVGYLGHRTVARCCRFHDAANGAASARWMVSAAGALGNVAVAI
jgi:hypothetical protein